MSRGAEVTVGTPEVVIATKLFAPSPRRQRLSRERLHGRLRAGLRVPLTLVVAPAGWGKTTVVAEWLRNDNITAGWVSLDAGDDDAKRFWRYLLLAANQASHEVGTSALRRLDGAGADVLRDVLPSFINDLAALSEDLLVVLEDYHLVSNPEVHDSLAVLLNRGPPQMHLVLITRADPALPLSRLRVRGDLVEVRADQLRFTLEEASGLLNGTLGLTLSPHDVQRLVQRTEGWAAGLQLAALRLADRSDRSEFIERFTGADRHVVDYLGEEVLHNQPQRIRDFLLHTSVVNRLCAPLCGALTERNDSAELLDEIYRANLFLTPLDDANAWFRYHHLFRGILRHELARTFPEQPPVLHRRAAMWFAAAGDLAEAIGHALESGDTELVAGLVAQGWQQHFNAGQMRTVQMWLDALPGEVVAGNVQLSVARAWLAMDAGRLDDASAALDAAERSVGPDVHLQLLRALHTYKAGDIGTAAGLLRAIRRPADEPFLATVHSLVSGISALWLGDVELSATQLRDAAETARRGENRLAHIYAVGCLALLAVERGDLPSAETLVRLADSEVKRTLSDAHFVAMFPALAQARFAAARADWANALPAARAAIELAERGAGRAELCAALLTAAMISRRHAPSGEGDQDGSRWLGRARAVLKDCQDPGAILHAWLATEQRARQAAQPARGAVEPLTEREYAIVRLLPGPMSQRQLASTLFVTPNTLKTHLRAIYRKLGAESRGEAVIRAREQGLL